MRPTEEASVANISGVHTSDFGERDGERRINEILRSRPFGVRRNRLYRELSPSIHFGSIL
jgi:hypothetical protein